MHNNSIQSVEKVTLLSDLFLENAKTRNFRIKSLVEARFHFLFRKYLIIYFFFNSNGILCSFLRTKMPFVAPVSFSYRSQDTEIFSERKKEKHANKCHIAVVVLTKII